MQIKFGRSLKTGNVSVILLPIFAPKVFTLYTQNIAKTTWPFFPCTNAIFYTKAPEASRSHQVHGGAYAILLV